MNTSPSIDDMLEGVIVALGDDILPALDNAKARATAVMMQSLLQGVRQMLPVYDTYLAEEHNAMTQVLRGAAETIGDTPGVAADRIRGRASTLGARDDLPTPVDRSVVMAAHRDVGDGLTATIRDLDELQRAGETSADAALQVVRAHFGPRFLRDVATVTVGEGFIGRG